MTGLSHVETRQPGILHLGRIILAKRGGVRGTWAFLTRAYK
jgi:hypothetical protein